jgi:threonine dehydrogenase-like Zn-dependent dehydrogenase
MGGQRRAAIVTGPGRIGLTTVPTPDPAAGEVEIEVAGCGICGTNLSHLKDPTLILADRRDKPGALGHEVAGRVSAVGPGVVTHHVGDLVALEPQLATACGACAECVAGAPWFCSHRTPLPVWGLTDRMVVKAAGAWRMPPAVDPLTATLMEPLAVSVHAIRATHTCTQRADDLSGLRIAVLGAGATGLLAVAAARYLRASSVVCVARHEHQVELARRLGADIVLRDRDPDPAEALKSLRPDIVVECVGGNAGTLTLAVEVCAPLGEVSVLGLFDAPQPINAQAAVRRELRMVFPIVYGSVGGRHDYDIAAEILQGPLPLGELVTHRVPLEEIDRAYATASSKSGGVVRVVVVPGPETAGP